MPISKVNTKPMQREIKEAVELIKRGGIIAVANETGWCHVCDSSNGVVVDRMLSGNGIKGSPYIMVEHVGQAENYFDYVSEVAWQILELSHTPTIVELPKPKNVASNLPDMHGMLGVKVAGTNTLNQLCKSMRKALATCELTKDAKIEADMRIDIDNDEIKFKSTSIIRLEKGDVIKSII